MSFELVPGAIRIHHVVTVQGDVFDYDFCVWDITFLDAEGNPVVDRPSTGAGGAGGASGAGGAAGQP